MPSETIGKNWNQGKVQVLISGQVLDIQLAAKVEKVIDNPR